MPVVLNTQIVGSISSRPGVFLPTRPVTLAKHTHTSGHSQWSPVLGRQLRPLRLVCSASTQPTDSSSSSFERIQEADESKELLEAESSAGLEATAEPVVSSTTEIAPPAARKAGARPEVSVGDRGQKEFSTGPGLQLIGLGLLSAAVLGAVFFLGKRFVSEQLPEMKKAMDQRSLQKEAQLRLDDFVGRLKTQATCDLSAQNLGEEGCQYVIEALAFNSVCVAVDLSKNGIGTLGTDALVQALRHNDLLQTLVMDTNNIGDEGAEALATYMAGNTALTTLNLSSNSIADAGARALAEMLKVNTTLRTLELGSNMIDYDGAVAIAESLSQNESLESLCLSDNYIGPMGASVLANALKSNRSLKKLYLKGNDLGDEGVRVISEALKESKCELTALDIGNNPIGNEGAEALAGFLTGNKTLEELNVNMNDIGNAGIYKVAEALKTCKSLHTLDMGGNSLTEEGTSVLVNALKGSESLKFLELGYNPIGEEGAKALAGVAKYDLPALETLKLGWCRIGGRAGALAISDLIMYNSTLQTLDLRSNGFGNDGAIQVSRGLRQHQNEHFNELDLSYNEIKDDGAFALAQALKANAAGSVQELKLSANYITRIGQVALTEAVDMVYDMSGRTKELTIYF